MACTNYLTITKPNTKETIKVPCGRCMACRIANREAWTHRIEDEASYYGTDTSFVTLTYDDEFLPVVSDVINGEHVHYPTLNKHHIQKFLKRLRYYRNQENPIRNKLVYFCVGEYGSLRGRAHYHLVLLGIDCVKDLHLLVKAWTYGIVDARPLNHGRIRYCLKYMDKQLFTDEEKSLVYLYSVPPFRLMSKSIGSSYLEEHIDDLIAGRYYRKGKPVAIPRYYFDSNTVYGSIDIGKAQRVRNHDYSLSVKKQAFDAGYFEYRKFIERRTALKIAEYEFKENNNTKGV